MQRRATPLKVALLVAATLGTASTVLAQDDDTAATETNKKMSETASEPADTQVTLGGMRVSIDPVTGDLRPLTPAEANRMAREMRQMFAPRTLGEPIERRDGTRSLVVAPNVLRFSVARIGEDGRAEIDCVDGEESATEFLGTPATPSLDTLEPHHHGQRSDSETQEQ